LSNHVDIIEAQTIACHADISHWDENDDSNKTVLSERYWRQTYDLKKLATDPRNALSKLRKFCVCGGYDNPGLDMFQCHKVGCGLWNHEACLVEDIESRAWEQFKKGQLSHEVEEIKAESKTITQKIAGAVGQIVDKALHKDEVKDEAGSGTLPQMGVHKKTKPAAGGKKPWTGKLKGQIIKTEKAQGEFSHRAIVTQLVPNSTSKTKSSFEPKVWNMEMSCLRCQQPLN